MEHALSAAISEIRSAWRFRWYGVSLAWAVFVLGWAWIVWLPSVYEASATVYIDTTSVLKPILNNQIVPVDITTQLSYIRQALLGREHVERVMKENRLENAAWSPPQRERAIDDLRDTIKIDVAATGGNNSTYTISFRDSKRDTAISVVSTLLRSLVEGTLGANREGTETAVKFLGDRISEYEARLQQAEQRLADFKKKNANILPGTQGGYFERMRAENDALDGAKKSLRLAIAKKEQLVAQLNSEAPVIPAGNAVDKEPPPNSLDARIRDLQAQLDKLLLDFTEKHPDVIATREALARLEKQRAGQLAALGVSDTNQELSQLGASPIHQALRIALNQTEVEIAGLQADVDDRAKEIKRLQALIDEVPEVEAELARLNRDYDVVYQQYQALIKSRETQDLSSKASDTDHVDFRVINPPSASFSPVAPRRLLLLAGLLVVSLGAAGGMCWLLSRLRPVFSDAAKLRELCGFPVLGAVSRVHDARQRVHRLVVVTGFASAVGGLVLIFAASALFEIAGPGLHSLLRTG